MFTGSAAARAALAQPEENAPPAPRHERSDFMKIAIIEPADLLAWSLNVCTSPASRGRAIVHAYRSLAVLGRFSLPWRVTDPSDPVRSPRRSGV